MREEIQSRLDEEMRAGMWDNERENMRAQVEKELLPAILIRGESCKEGNWQGGFLAGDTQSGSSVLLAAWLHRYRKLYERLLRRKVHLRAS